jgi:protein involved in sex pheromone biosynthesis
MKFITSIDTTASKLMQLQTEIMLLSKEERSSESIKKIVLLKALSKEYYSMVFALKAASLLTMSFNDII